MSIQENSASKFMILMKMDLLILENVVFSPVTGQNAFHKIFNSIIYENLIKGGIHLIYQ